MKRSILFCAVLLLFTAFKCDNEPLEGEFVSESQVSCEIAIENVQEALALFENAQDDNYTELCIAYKNALIRQIEFCGDPGGLLQTEVNNLGNCGEIEFVDDCVAAAAAVGEAQAAFALATTENYIELCLAYRETLFQLIEFCGDDGGTQSVINDLGDCLPPESVAEGFISLNAGTSDIEFVLITVVKVGNTLQITGETGSPAYYIIDFDVEVGATGNDLINDSFRLTLSSQFFPSSAGFDDFTSTITTNSPGNLIGSFNGLVTNAEGADLGITSGVISISYED